MKQDRGIEAELCFHPVPGNTVHALSNSAYENENLTLKLREDLKGSRVDKITGKVKMWGITVGGWTAVLVHFLREKRGEGGSG